MVTTLSPRPVRATVALIALAFALVAAAPASAQYILFPRIGLSAAPDHYVSSIEIEGDATFELYVLCLGPENGEPLTTGISELKWGILEACCGGAAQVVDVSYSPVCQHEGNILDIVTSTPPACLQQDMIQLATLTLQMADDIPSGHYYIIGGPRYPGLDCAGENVILSDLMVTVDYTLGEGQTPANASSWGDVKSLYR